MNERRANITVISFVLALLLQTATFAYFLGQVVERVNSVQKTTDTLLQLQLEKSQRSEVKR